jgi:nitroreductase
VKALELLHGRVSHSVLIDPAPDDEVLEMLFRAALRAPDHKHLRPWRFLIVRGTARERLGELQLEGLLRHDPEASEKDRRKAAEGPARAPLIVVVIARLQPHPKVPEVEQLIAAGCAAHGILLAAHALNYGGVWRTGAAAYDSIVRDGLGITADERIVGVLYLGTPAQESRTPYDEPPGEFVERWTG